MIGKMVFVCTSLAAIATIHIFYAKIRASGLQDERMKGFNALCTVVPFWICMSMVTAIAAPEIYAPVYALKVAILNVVPSLSIWFILHFTESKLANSRVFKGYLIAMPAVALVFLSTNTIHKLYFLETPAYGEPEMLGPLFISHMALSILSLLFIYVRLFWYAIINYKSRPLTLMCAVGAIIPILVYIVFLFSPHIIYDFTSLGYFFTIVAFAYTSYYTRIRDAKPGLLGDTLAVIAKAKEVSTGVIEDAARLISKQGCNALGAYKLSVWILDSETHLLRNIAVYDRTGDAFSVLEDIDMTKIVRYDDLLKVDRVFTIDNVSEYLEKKPAYEIIDRNIVSLIGSPIRIGDKLIGVLYVEQNKSGVFPQKRAWNKDEQAFVSSLADIMAIAVTNAERQEMMRRLETELIEKTEFSNMAFSQSPIGLSVFEDSHKVIDCNDAILKMFGVTREYYIENFKSFSPEFQPDGSRSVEKHEILKQQAIEKGTITVEWMHNDVHGNLIPCEVTIASIRQGDVDIGITYVYNLTNRNKILQNLRDTTAQLEEALHRANEASKAKTDFLAKMSHEIRTPMNAIIGMTELALRETDAKSKDEHIFTVKQAGSNLLAIISDILDISKIESGKMELITSDYSLSSMLDDMISIIRMRVVGSPIRFAVMIDSSAPRILHGDETRVRQAVLNILNNAAKYTSNGYVMLTLDCDEIDDNKVNLIFSIKDTGRGIKKEDIDKLFEEFAQFDVEKNAGIEGVGLGLSIAQKIVKTMGGTIDVVSEHGKGSTFTLTIPQERRSAEPMAIVSDPEDKSVIVYERRDLYAGSVTYSLTSLGVENVLVTSEAELKEALASNKYKYLFIPYVLLNKMEIPVNKYGDDIIVVILSEFGEAIPGKHKYMLSMPVYCTSIADMLNGVSSSYTYAVDGEVKIRFSAPDAKILLVDDIYTNLKVAEGLLAPYNVQVELCNSGYASLEAVQKESYDIIFMDHKMPKMDGVEAMQRIKEMGIETPIIALTANAVAGVIEMFLEKGFDDFLTKPIDTIRLNAVLEKWIPKEKQRRN